MKQYLIGLCIIKLDDGGNRMSKIIQNRATSYIDDPKVFSLLKCVIVFLKKAQLFSNSRKRQKNFETENGIDSTFLSILDLLFPRLNLK